MSWSFVLQNPSCPTAALTGTDTVSCLSILGFTGRTSTNDETCRLVSESANCIQNAVDTQHVGTDCSIDEIMSAPTNRMFMKALVPATVLDNCTVHEEPDICTDNVRLSAFGFTTCTPWLDVLDNVPSGVLCSHIGLLVDCISQHVNMLGRNCTRDVIGDAIVSTAGQSWLQAYNAELVPFSSSPCN